MGMPVVAEVGRVEDDDPVEDRRDGFHALLAGTIPELQLAAPGGIPVLIEIQQKIEPPPEVQTGMQIEVRVDAEGAFATDLVQTAAADMRIGNQSLDAGQTFEKVQKQTA